MGINWKIVVAILIAGFLLMFANSLFWGGKRMDPESIHYYTEGMNFFQAGHYEQAVLSLVEVVRRNPTYPSVYYNLGLAYDAGGKAYPAIQAYKKALELNPRYAKAYFSLGGVYEVTGDLANAEECYRMATRIEPRNADAYFLLAKIQMRTRDFDNANINFIKAREYYEQRNDFENVRRVEAEMQK